MKLLALCVLGFLSLATAHSIVEIDNSVIGDPEVQCESDSISLLFLTKNPFIGKIFVKGFVSDDNCVDMGDNKKNHRFSVKHDSCGVRRQREVNGVVVITTVIVSFHSIFITKVDRAYRLSCFYVESTKKVQQQLDVAALTTQALDGQTQLPVCRYEILSDGPSGVPIKYARVGDTVYHKWTCVSELEDVYCMKVHSCTVYDGQGGPPVTVLDANGCSIDGIILQNLDYLSDLSAGKPAQVFKFADKTGLYFNCQIRLTIKDKQYGCSSARPSCGRGQTYVEPSSRTTEISSNEESGEDYATKPAVYPTTQDSYTTDRYATSQYAISTDEPQDNDAAVYPKASNQKNIITLPKEDNRLSHAPGTNPTYADLQVTTNEPYVEREGSAGAAARLVKRNTWAYNKSLPVTVADFDLPEKGLIVFGLEENGNNQEDIMEGDTARFIIEDRMAKTCFTTNKLMALMVLIFIFSTALLFVMAFIVYRQRRLISRSFLKH